MDPKTACFPAQDSETPRGFRGGRLARRLGLLAALLALPSAALAATATAAVVTVKGKASGTVKLLNPSWTEAKDPKSHRFTFREPSLTVRPDVRNLTGYLPKELCIVALVEGKAPTPKVALRMTMAGGRTSPVTLVVAEGQQIQFENLDPFPHKLYDVGGKGFAVAGRRRAQGNTRSATRARRACGPGSWSSRAPRASATPIGRATSPSIWSPANTSCAATTTASRWARSSTSSSRRCRWSSR
jgi:hypothetical protein